MSLTISGVRAWTPTELKSTAGDLRGFATTAHRKVKKLLDGLQRLERSACGAFFDHMSTAVKSHVGDAAQRAKRWTAAADVLDDGAKDLADFKDAILARADDPENKRKFNIGDDGSVTTREDYVKDLTADELDKTREAALDLSTQLRSLLATASLCAARTDWLTSNALDGLTEQQRPFVPAIPPPPIDAAASNARQAADREGNGPGQYGSWQPGVWEKARLLSERLAAAQGSIAYAPLGALASLGAGGLGPTAQGLLGHWLKNDGSVALLDVNQLLAENAAFASAAANYRNQRTQVALAAMPPGYRGPVAFQAPFKAFSARPTLNPDYYLGLGSFSYQVSGVATPTVDGHYTIAAQTSIYDYYNFNATGSLSGLNDLHRAGWAQNFDVVGTSTTQAGNYP